MFNTLIALTDSGAIRPPVTPLSSGRMAGYRIADSNRTLIYLFNPEGDSNRTARYDQFSFQGKILLACAARDSGQWTVFTEYGPASPRISAGPPARKHTRLIVYANPGKSAVSFGFNNPPAAGNIKILIYNSAGACVADLTKSGTGAGTIFWDGSRTAAGVYCARMFVNGKSVALGRFALMK